MRRTDQTPDDELAASFTPGPWSVQDIPSVGVEVHWREPRKGELNAPVCHMRWTSGMDPVTEARVLADARLIAAAPDLLAALKGLVEAVDATASPVLSASHLEPGRVAIARAAIAKAEGQ